MIIFINDPIMLWFFRHDVLFYLMLATVIGHLGYWAMRLLEYWIVEYWML